MGTFQARTEDYVGTISDTAALADWFTAGAKRLIDLIPPEKLERFSTTLTDSSSGVDVSAHRFIRAHKAGRGAVLIDAGLKTQAADSTSIFYGTATSPVCYLEATKAYVLPGGGSIIAVSYPTVTYSASSISNFPTEWEQGVILFAAIQAAIGLMNTSITTLSGLSLGAISTTPSAPADAAYSYSNASLGTYTATTIDSLGTAPTYTKPTISMTTAVAALDMSAITLPSAPTDFSLTATVPTAPTDASYSYTDATLGTYTATSVGAWISVAAYAKPTTTFDITTATTYIGTDEDLEKAQQELSKQSLLLDQYGKDLYNELNEFNTAIEESKSLLTRGIEQAKLDQQRLMMEAEKTTDLSIQNKAKTLEKDIQLYLSKLQNYSTQVNSYQASVNAEVQAYQQLIDKYRESLNAVRIQVEKAVQEYRANLERWQTQRQTELSEYSANMQNELNEFNKENAEYVSTVQKAIRQAELDQERLMLSASKTTDLNLQNAAQTLNAAIELYKTKMEKYLGQINQYGAEVNKVVNEYQIKVQQAQTVTDKYQMLVTQLQNEYKAFLETIR